MNSRFFLAIVYVFALSLSAAYGQQSVQIFPTYDCYGEDDTNNPHSGEPRGADTVAYICELGEYQVWFGFDMSAIPPGSTITSMTLTAYIVNEEDAERTLWYRVDDSWITTMLCPDLDPGDELVAAAPLLVGGPRWETIDIDLSGHSWDNDLADGFVSLMLTGPLDGEHRCGEVWLRDEVEAPFLTVNFAAGIPTLNRWTMALFLVLLCGAAVWIMRRKRMA